MVLRLSVLILAVFTMVTAQQLAESNASPRMLLDFNVYRITVSGDDNWGSAFPIEYKNKKYIITNRHVCRSLKATGKQIILKQEFSHKQHNTEIITMSNKTDLCALKYPSTMTGAFRLGSRQRYEQTYTAGYDNKYYIRQLVGWFSVKRVLIIPLDQRGAVDNSYCLKPQTLMEFFYFSVYCVAALRVDEYDFLVLPGHSGSPIIDQSGKVVGVVFAYQPKTHASYAVPASELSLFLKRTLLGRADRGR